jgi:hypothetical protein
VTLPHTERVAILPRLLWLLNRSDEPQVSLDRASLAEAVQAIGDLATAVETSRTWLGALRPDAKNVELLMFRPGLRRRLLPHLDRLTEAMDRVIETTYGGPCDDANRRVRDILTEACGVDGGTAGSAGEGGVRTDELH